jgi:hypothetical protein
MVQRRRPEPARAVFINCPFDGQYAPILRAVVFTIAAADYHPRCALEENDSGQIRFDKLTRMIAACQLGIHDLSRVEVSEPDGPPRFNMAFELGLFLGAARFGGAAQKRKRCLILARNRRQWSPSISDLAGVDPEFHGDSPQEAMKHVRDFLHATPDGVILPGERDLWRSYQEFQSALAEAARRARQTLEEAQRYRNYTHFLYEFLKTPAG